MLKTIHDLLLQHLRMREHLFDAAGSSAGYFVTKQRFPFLRGVRCQRYVQSRNDFSRVLRPFSADDDLKAGCENYAPGFFPALGRRVRNFGSTSADVTRSRSIIVKRSSECVSIAARPLGKKARNSL